MILVWFGCIQAFAEPFAKGPYMGQAAPGFTAKVFAPGIISLENRYEYGCHFSRDGKQFSFTVTNSGWDAFQIYYTSQDAIGIWSEPEVPRFCLDYFCGQPFFSADGQTIYFISVRPSEPPYPVDIYKAQWNGEAWSDAMRIPAPVSTSERDWHPTVADNGTLYYFIRGAGIHRAFLVEGVYTEVERLPSTINNPSAAGPTIAPDESYLIFISGRPGGYGKSDFYISFRQSGNQWSEPQNLGPQINTNAIEDCGFVTGDGKYFFFCRRAASSTSIQTDIHWIDARAIFPDPNGPVFNMMTGQRFALIQTAINYAQPGQTILLSPGEYKENIILPPKEVTIRSANAQDSAVVSLTTISDDNQSPIVSLLPGSTIKLLGLTICDGAIGISCSQAQLQMNHCVVTGNHGCGIEVNNESHLEMSHCIVAGNAEAGLRSLVKTVGRKKPPYSHVDITNCTIVQNQQYAIDGKQIAVTNSILYFNGQDGAQINGTDINVTFSDVQGGCQGDGNIDANPEFVQLGTWDDLNVPILGDYHLKSIAGHWGRGYLRQRGKMVRLSRQAGCAARRGRGHSYYDPP
jgi:hypothetical protein